MIFTKSSPQPDASCCIKRLGTSPVGVSTTSLVVLVRTKDSETDKAGLAFMWQGRNPGLSHVSI